MMRWIPLVVALCSLAPHGARAIPFEVITATEVGINTYGGRAISFTAWAWIGGAGLTDELLRDAVMTVSFSDPSVTVSPRSLATTEDFTLGPGEFAGKLSNFTNSFNATYEDELGSAEALAHTLSVPISFSYATSHVADGTLQVTLEIAGESLAWSTTVHLLNSGRHFETLGSQRLSVVPEPVGLVLVGSVGMMLARRRRLHR